MSFKIIAIESFKHQAKKLSKKYPSLKNDIGELEVSLSNKPDFGIPIGQNCYKIRLAIKSKGQGKSGGSRVITNVAIVQNTVFLLSIYDKSEMDNISDLALKRLLKQLPD